MYLLAGSSNDFLESSESAAILEKNLKAPSNSSMSIMFYHDYLNKLHNNLADDFIIHVYNLELNGRAYPEHTFLQIRAKATQFQSSQEYNQRLNVLPGCKGQKPRTQFPVLGNLCTKGNITI